ncbi:Multidrug resistance protein NorM [Vibrio scophthalmi]|uniref:Multidrug resistance protein NorM n=1 Tax=Vibrio scophthalmi TaxID=45658 RepID=A0A1C7FBS1_9VIBR|nr:Multidrug resistance protein NorM [Vibrio scophthalmi]
MHRYKQEANTLIKLATPVLIASVAQTGMGFVDTVMAGGVSAIDMAAVSIASSIWLPSILFGVGLLMALVPIVAQLNGSGKVDQIPFQIQHGFVMALLISIPIIGVLFQTQSILDLMDVDVTMSVKNGWLHACGDVCSSRVLNVSSIT